MPTAPPPIVIETTQTLDTMLHQILNQALVAIQAKAGSLMLVDNKHGILQIKARLGEPRPGRKNERVFTMEDRSIAGLVARTMKPHLCPDVSRDPNFLASRSGRNFMSVLAVPIVHNDRVIAVINADSAEPGYFQQPQLEILDAVARQVAGPLAERTSIVDALAVAGLELAKLPRMGQVERVLEKIAELAVRSLGADVVTLYQFDEATDEFLVERTGPTIRGSLYDRRPMRTRVHPGDVPWTVVKERKPGFFPNVEEVDFLTQDVPRPGEDPRRRFVAREHIKSMAALLLPFRAAESESEEVVGVMFANYRNTHTFNIDETAALATFADYAAAAILNVRHEERRRVEHMRAMESDSASFAHRMSNLAGASRAAVQLIRDRIDGTDQIVSRLLGTVEREADVLMALSGGLARRFAGPSDTFDPVAVQVSALLQQELDRLYVGERDIQIEARIDPDLPAVRSAEFQLRQVLSDVMKNAVEAMANQDQGTLTVEATLDTTTTDQVQITISDTGTGISKGLVARLFSPGVTTKDSHLGIGLWYSRTFLRATGGDIKLVKTALGQGTTFVIEIPRADTVASTEAR